MTTVSTPLEIPTSGADKKIAAGLLALFLGAFGLHKFYLGYFTAGIITLVVTLFSCGTIMFVIGIVEGIIYLTRTDEQFTATYVVGRKEWF
jgi:TM2 domain-containing membrane protein YozV